MQQKHTVEEDIIPLRCHHYLLYSAWQTVMALTVFTVWTSSRLYGCNKSNRIFLRSTHFVVPHNFTEQFLMLQHTQFVELVSWILKKNEGSRCIREQDITKVQPEIISTNKFQQTLQSLKETTALNDSQLTHSSIRFVRSLSQDRNL